MKLEPDQTMKSLAVGTSLHKDSSSSRLGASPQIKMPLSAPMVSQSTSPFASPFSLLGSSSRFLWSSASVGSASVASQAETRRSEVVNSVTTGLQQAKERNKSRIKKIRERLEEQERAAANENSKKPSSDDVSESPTKEEIRRKRHFVRAQRLSKQSESLARDCASVSSNAPESELYVKSLSLLANQLAQQHKPQRNESIGGSVRSTHVAAPTADAKAILLEQSLKLMAEQLAQKAKEVENLKKEISTLKKKQSHQSSKGDSRIQREVVYAKRTRIGDDIMSDITSLSGASSESGTKKDSRQGETALDSLNELGSLEG